MYVHACNFKIFTYHIKNKTDMVKRLKQKNITTELGRDGKIGFTGCFLVTRHIACHSNLIPVTVLQDKEYYSHFLCKHNEFQRHKVAY